MKRTIIFVIATMISFCLTAPAFAGQYEKPMAEAVGKGAGVFKDMGSGLLKGLKGDRTIYQNLCVSLENQSGIVTGNRVFMKKIPKYLKAQAQNNDTQAQELVSVFQEYVHPLGKRVIKKLPKDWSKFWTMSFFWSARSYKCDRKADNAITLIVFLESLHRYLKKRNQNDMADSMDKILAIVSP